jgi:two-component system CheB/CheR fusion protein
LKTRGCQNYRSPISILRALEQAAPPSIIVDANANILHMSEGAGRFLRHVGGEMSRNLLTLAHAGAAPGNPHHAVPGTTGGLTVTSRKVRNQARRTPVPG